MILGRSTAWSLFFFSPCEEGGLGYTGVVSLKKCGWAGGEGEVRLGEGWEAVLLIVQ
jgi:hypothetical protein